jgi:hypothetical protein
MLHTVLIQGRAGGHGGRPKLTTEQREDPALQERRRQSALKTVACRREREVEQEKA